MATEKLGYLDRSMRDDKAKELKENYTGVTTYTTHEGKDPDVIFVVSWNSENLKK